MDRLTELQNDKDELNKLLSQAERPSVRAFLNTELKRLQLELTSLLTTPATVTQDAGTPASMAAAATARPTSVVKPHATVYTKKIDNYAWDQSEKFVKIYVTLKGVHNLAKENVVCTFTPSSFSLLVKELDGKNLELTIPHLCEKITADGSSIKVKTDNVLIMLKKEQSKSWAQLTQQDKKKDDMPKLDDKKDPSDGIMDLMRKMYDDGDDEMKRTISKAWYEAQSKKGGGATGDF